MHPPNPLFDAHRVPRKIVIDDVPAKLEVVPFSTRLGGHHAPALGAIPQDRLLSSRRRHAAVKEVDDKTSFSQGLSDLAVAGANLGIDDGGLLEGARLLLQQLEFPWHKP